jgi:hypothetical protein
MHMFRWVWFSNAVSRREGVISVLAACETVFCAFLYWFIWIHWGFVWQHWAILLTTPLVLLRSKRSTLKAKQMFSAYWMAPEIPIMSRASVFYCAIVFVVSIASFLYAYTSIFHISGWSEAFIVLVSCFSLSLSCVFIFCVIFNIEWDWLILPAFIAVYVLFILVTVLLTVFSLERGQLIQFLAPFIAIMAIPGLVALGSWARAIATRFISVASHPVSGLKALPDNWRYEIFCTDSMSPIELMPGHRASSLNSFITEWRMGFGRGRNFFAVLSMMSFAVFSVTYYVAPILWRFAIKSTAWFYLPLLWVGRGWQNFTDAELLIWTSSYSKKWIHIVGTIISTILLFTSLFSLLIPEQYFNLRAVLSDAGAPMPLIGLVFVLEWNSLISQPWQWFYMPSWTLSLFLFFILDSHAKDISSGSNTVSHLVFLRVLMWSSNLRAALTNTGLAVALWYFLSATGVMDSLFHRTGLG